MSQKFDGRRLAIASLATLAMLVAACGDDDDESSTTSTEAPATSSPSDDEFQLDEPLHIVAAVEITGDSPVAIDDYFNGIQMAVDDINDAGGVGGQMIKLDRVATPIDAEGSVTAFRKAAELEPDMIIGFAGNGIQAIAADVEETGIPVISQVADTAIELGGPAGSEWIFHPYPSVDGIAESAGEFVVEDLEASEVGIMHINTPYGETVSEGATDAIEALDGTIVDKLSYPTDSTDLTTEVQAVQGADAVINVAFPSTLVVQLDQFAQAQVDVPTLVPSNAAPLAVRFALVDDSLLGNLYGLVACNPAGGDTPQAADFAEAYQERFDSAPSGFSSMAYDSVFLAVDATENAGSTDGEALRDSLGNVDFDGGVCAESYQTDARNVMSHSAVAVSYADGVGETLRTFELPAATEPRG